MGIAIRASGDDPERIGEWPEIRHLLRKRFGQDRSEVELWERFTDWLRAECGLDPEEYLRIPLRDMRDLLVGEPSPGGAVTRQIVLERLSCFAAAMQALTQSAEYLEAAPEDRLRWGQLADAIRAVVGDAPEDSGDQRPALVAKFEHRERLARVVRTPAIQVRAGRLTTERVFETTLAWANQCAIDPRRGPGAVAVAAERRGEASAPASERRQRRSTERGEAQVKLIAALTKHHGYSEDSCLNTEPIGNNELAKLAGVAASTVSLFMKQKFKGRRKYLAMCNDVGSLVAALKLLNHEFTPAILCGGSLFGQSQAPRDEPEDEE